MVKNFLLKTLHLRGWQRRGRGITADAYKIQSDSKLIVGFCLCNGFGSFPMLLRTEGCSSMFIGTTMRFCVKWKERIASFKTSVDVLTLSVTLVPRALYLALIGSRDASLISTPPSERGPITYLSSYSEEKVSSAIKFELDCSGQVFYALPCNKGLEEVLQFLERSFPDVARAIEVAGLKHDEEYYQVGGGDDNEGDGGGNDDEDGGEDDSDGDEEDEDLGGSNGEGDWEDGEDEEDEEDEEDDDEEDEEDSEDEEDDDEEDGEDEEHEEGEEDEEDDDEEDGEDEEHEEGEEDEEGEGPQHGEEDYEKDIEDDEIDEDVHIMDILEGYEVHGITHSGRDALFNEFLTHRNIDREEFLKWLTGRGDEKSLWWSKFLLLTDDDCEKVLETVCKLWSRSQKKHLSGKARILDMKRVFALRQIKAAGIKIKDWFFYVSKGQGIDEPEEWWKEVESYPKGLLTTRLYLYTGYCREFLRKLGREVGDFVEDWEQDTSSEDGGGGDDGLRGDND